MKREGVLMKRLMFSFLILGLAMALWSPGVQAGKIVVANDEWTLSNTSFDPPSDPNAFAPNVARWFTGGGPGNFLAYSDNFGLTESLLAAAMTAAANTWTVSTAVDFTVANLLTYDGVFLAGNSVDNNVLIAYVNAGGNVYLAGGTGWGGDWNWNTFLNAFGLSFANSYNGVSGDIPISSTHPLFEYVDALYQNNGQDISDLDASDLRNQILVSYNGRGLYAIYDSTVPVPGAVWLLGSGLLGLLGWKRGWKL